MKLSEIYKQSIEMGMKADPRGANSVKLILAENKKNYEKLSDKEKVYYEKERLENPYSDTRILHGDASKEVKKIMAAIDIDDGELIIAKQRGDIDLSVAHHPEGIALAGLDDVMHMQADVLAQYGVPINIAEALLYKRISEVSRGLSPGNHYRVVEIARLLDQSFICLHTVADNLAYTYLKNLVEKEKPQKVGDIIDMLLEIPEYQQAEKMGFGPKIFSGKKENRAGVIAVTEFTGGTEGAHDIYEKMAQAGIGTVIAMHQSERHREYAEKAFINVVVAGHMSSDSLGMNQLLDVFEKNGVEIIPCGGLIRVSRAGGKK